MITLPQPTDQLAVSRSAATRYELHQALRSRHASPRRPSRLVRRIRHAVAGGLMITARAVDVR